MLLEVGRVCIKTTGHEAQQKCAVVDTAGENFVVVAGPRVKRRKCNIKHLNILPHTINVKKGATEAEVVDSLLKAGIITEADMPKKPSGYTPKPAAAKKAAEKPVAKSAEKPTKAEHKTEHKAKPAAKKE